MTNRPGVLRWRAASPLAVLGAWLAAFPAPGQAFNNSYETLTMTCPNPLEKVGHAKGLFKQHNFIGHALLGYSFNLGGYLAFGPTGIGNSPLKAGFYGAGAAVSGELAKEYATEGAQGCSDVHGAGFWFGTAMALATEVAINSSFGSSSPQQKLPRPSNLRDAQHHTMLPAPAPFSEERQFKHALLQLLPLFPERRARLANWTEGGKEEGWISRLSRP